MNKRIIVIDDEESILEDYLRILCPPQADVALIEEKAALEAELFGEPLGPDQTVQESYEVITALQGRDGFDEVRKARERGTPFVMAFIDIRMPPGWDGLQTAKRIREVDKEIEIVVVTAYSDRQRREIVEKVGMPERLLYLKKPFDPDEIRQLALSLTRKWDLERKEERHKVHLECLLNAVRRLKTLSICTIKEVLSAILKEVLDFVDARKGLIAKVHDNQICLELASECFLPHDIGPILEQMEQISRRSIQKDLFFWINETMVVPLRDLSGNYFIMVLDLQPPVSSGRLELLQLLLEASSEVLVGFRKQEQLLKNDKIATIGEIAAGFIHEVSSPLTALSGALELNRMEAKRMDQFFHGYLRLLEQPEFPPLLRERFLLLNRSSNIEKTREKAMLYQDILLKGVERIHALTGNIRNFSKIRDTFKPGHHEVGSALEDTLMLAYGMLRSGIRVHREWESPLIAWCDPDGLKQVFLNIILNAVQAMEGVGELWIGGKREGSWILVSMRDSGPGMTLDSKERIFEAFYSTKPEGTGLGLSIGKSIIEKHGGAIRVESEPGEGTTFHLKIPTDAPEESRD